MVKLFSKNSNLCDHNSPTSQTDKQTDGQTTCDRNTALCTKVRRAVKKSAILIPFCKVRIFLIGLYNIFIGCLVVCIFVLLKFLADHTNGLAIGTLLRPSVVVVVCRRL